MEDGEKETRVKTHNNEFYTITDYDDEYVRLIGFERGISTLAPQAEAKQIEINIIDCVVVSQMKKNACNLSWHLLLR